MTDTSVEIPARITPGCSQLISRYSMPQDQKEQWLAACFRSIGIDIESSSYRELERIMTSRFSIWNIRRLIQSIEEDPSLHTPGTSELIVSAQNTTFNPVNS